MGPPGSGTRFLALALLKANEIEAEGQTQLLDWKGRRPGRPSSQQADAIFLTGDSGGAKTIRELLHSPGTASVRIFTS